MSYARRPGLPRRREVAAVTRTVLGAVWLALATAAVAHAQPPPGGEFGPPPPAPTPAQAPAPAREVEPDPPASVSIALGIALGVATQEQLDDTLASLGYERSESVVGGDGTVLFAVTPWLWLGGRALLRARDWGREGHPSVSAMGIGLLAAAEARLTLGRSLGLAFEAGGGGGIASVRMNDSTDSPFAPAAYGGLRLLARLGVGAHFFGRFGYVYFEATDLGGTRLDVNLSGVTFGFGLEVRR